LPGRFPYGVLSGLFVPVGTKSLHLFRFHLLPLLFTAHHFMYHGSKERGSGDTILNYMTKGAEIMSDRKKKELLK
jgi:hypothetical protein